MTEMYVAPLQQKEERVSFFFYKNEYEATKSLPHEALVYDKHK